VWYIRISATLALVFKLGSSQPVVLKLASIQATLKYAAKLDAAIEAGEGIDKYQGEAFIFYHAIEPQVARYDLVGAASLSARFLYTNTPSTGNYVDAYCVFDAVLSLFETTWEEIGTYAGAPVGQVNCENRTLSGREEEVAADQCEAGMIDEMAAECAKKEEVAELLGNAESLNALCGLKQ
jgi:hypothetical protein